MIELRTAHLTEMDVRTVYLMLKVRTDVFVVEQQAAYPDLDGRDIEPGTRHIWAEDEGVPVGCLRILEDGDVARIGRLAVIPEHRGTGLGARLMRAALDRIGERTSVLDAQSRMASWYEHFGFEIDGPEFHEDDGIPHHPMRRSLTL